MGIMDTMNSINSQIGSRIREYRVCAGLTQEKLALSSGINVSFLGDIERGNKKPSLEKLLAALGVTFREFFDFEVDIRPYKDNPTLEKLNAELQGRPENEIEMIYGIVKQVLAFNDIE